MLAGGSNGTLYLFQKITCSASRKVMKGKVQCLEIVAAPQPGTYWAVIGGQGGVVKVLEARSLVELQSFSLLEAVVQAPLSARPAKFARASSARRASSFKLQVSRSRNISI